MTAASLVLLYSALVAWWVPAGLSWLTEAGTRPRLGIAVWLTAMASVLCSAVVALYFVIAAAVHGWMHLAVVICRSVSGGGVCTPVVYTSVLTALGLGLVAVAAAVVAAVASWRCAGQLRQARRQTRTHANTARLAGRPLPVSAASPAAVVLDVPQLAAYCVPPGIIVVTTGALGVLGPAQLDAVLAHERAHLAGRHHLVTAITRGLATAFPAVPLFARGKAEVARLAEMAADDVAARRAGRRPLAEALLALGTGAPVASPALAASGYAVAARVERLLAPAGRGGWARSVLGLAGVVAVLAVLPGLAGTVIAYAGAA